MVYMYEHTIIFAVQAKSCLSAEGRENELKALKDEIRVLQASCNSPSYIFLSCSRAYFHSITCSSQNTT